MKKKKQNLFQVRVTGWTSAVLLKMNSISGLERIRIFSYVLGQETGKQKCHDWKLFHFSESEEYHNIKENSLSAGFF